MNWAQPSFGGRSHTIAHPKKYVQFALALYCVKKTTHSDLAISGGITEKVNIVSNNGLLQVQCHAIT